MAAIEGAAEERALPAALPSKEIEVGHAPSLYSSERSANGKQNRPKLIRGENRAGDRLRILRLTGSLFPKTMCVAFPVAVVTYLLKLAANHEVMNFEVWAPMTNGVSWSSFSALVGFLIVFRTSQAYTRFWDGCGAAHAMRAEWYDACSSLISFTHHSQRGPEESTRFRELLVRLFSILHAVALAEMEDKATVMDADAFGFELIDPKSLDRDCLIALKHSRHKVHLVFQWIQSAIVHEIGGVLSIPPPILSGVYHELSCGMVAFNSAKKISDFPFPFPYAQTCEALLVLHYVITPCVVAQWVDGPIWAGVFSFIQVFTLCALNFIANEIENPFGDDDNDLDAYVMQGEMNEILLQLITDEALRIPSMAGSATGQLPETVKSTPKHASRLSISLREVWALPTPVDSERALVEYNAEDSAVAVLAGLQTAAEALGAHMVWHSDTTFALTPRLEKPPRPMPRLPISAARQHVPFNGAVCGDESPMNPAQSPMVSAARSKSFNSVSHFSSERSDRSDLGHSPVHQVQLRAVQEQIEDHERGGHEGHMSTDMFADASMSPMMSPKSGGGQRSLI